MTVTFTGIENPLLPGLLALEASSEAKGIAIGLETLAGERLPLGKPSTKYDLQMGSNTLALKAYVQGEAKAIADRTIKRGTFRSVTATFKLDYE
ncbi:Major MR/P fimbria protein precursor [compost metagenome]